MCVSEGKVRKNFGCKRRDENESSCENSLLPPPPCYQDFSGKPLRGNFSNFWREISEKNLFLKENWNFEEKDFHLKRNEIFLRRRSKISLLISFDDDNRTVCWVSFVRSYCPRNKKRLLFDDETTRKAIFFFSCSFACKTSENCLENLFPFSSLYLHEKKDSRKKGRKFLTTKADPNFRILYQTLKAVLPI